MPVDVNLLMVGYGDRSDKARDSLPAVQARKRCTVGSKTTDTFLLRQ
jgi:hypothetical protein